MLTVVSSCSRSQHFFESCILVFVCGLIILRYALWVDLGVVANVKRMVKGKGEECQSLVE